MTEGEYTSATFVVVDSHAPEPPVLPRLRPGRWCLKVAQTLVLSVVLCGIALATCFIYHLYQHDCGSSPWSTKLNASEGVTSPTERTNYVCILPSKPVAHLTDGQGVVHGDQIMMWSMNAEPLLNKMEYKDGSLIILKEGFYYVYSKVCFLDQNEFHHYIYQKCKFCSGSDILLLTFRKITVRSDKRSSSNSYLGGVFHLRKGDALFVKVSDTSKVFRHTKTANVFGAHMI